MKLIVRAADYGMTDSITDGCLKAIRDGILTDVGLMTNDISHCKRAVEEVLKYSHVSIGQDLNLVSGKPCSDPRLIPHLVDENGIFISSTTRKNRNLYNIPYEEIYIEMKAQIDRFIELVGKKPCYLAGHSLATPEVNKCMEDMRNEYNIHGDIFDNDKLPVCKRWYYKNMVVDPNDRKPSYSLDCQSKTDVISHIINNEVEYDFSKPYALLATHCGYCDGELLNMSTFSVIRGKELEALCSDKVKKWVKDNNIELVNFEQYLNCK